MVNKEDLSKIGIGTWGIGGFAERNPQNDDEKQIKAISHALQKGLNIIELNMWLAQGYGSKLISEALKLSKVKRENIFLKQSVYRFTAKDLNMARKEIDDVFKLFNTDCLDSFELGLPNLYFYGVDKSIEFMKILLKDNITRYISVANANIETLKLFKKEFGEKLFSSEIGINFEIRENDDLGVIKYADDNKIKNIVLQPLRRGRTVAKNHPLLAELSNKYEKTQSQIIINWLVSKNLLPLIKSESIEHIDENLAALNFEMEKLDLDKLNNFRVSWWKTPRIDWNGVGDGVKIDQLSNIFDEEYNKQNGL